jgi:hypothetical protein
MRYEENIHRWQGAPAYLKLDKQRGPTRLVNLFAERSQMRIDKRNEFHRLELQGDRRDPVGDLEADVMCNRRFPIDEEAIEGIRRYLSSIQTGSLGGTGSSGRGLDRIRQSMSSLHRRLAQSEFKSCVRAVLLLGVRNTLRDRTPLTRHHFDYEYQRTPRFRSGRYPS